MKKQVARDGVPHNAYAAWVLSTFAGLRPATQFYVDLAANHPTQDSSTHELEQRGWHGLCIEPNPEYVALLKVQRNCTTIPTAIDSHERDVNFEFAGTMGGIEDARFDNRAGTKGRMVSRLRTRRLQDVLREANAPHVIDFLSLDVEGAESAVLSPSFPWGQYTFLTISIERAPPDLNARLFAHGYLFVKQLRADTMYVHSTHPRAAIVAANLSFVQGAAKCRNGQTVYSERRPLVGVHCGSIFGCCAFPGFPPETTRYLRPVGKTKEKPIAAIRPSHPAARPSQQGDSWPKFVAWLKQVMKGRSRSL